MEMCYDGAIVMPSSYAEMNEEEMLYLEGGIGATVKWWGIRVALNSTETNAVAVGSSIYNYALGVAIGIPSAVAGVLVGALATFRGAKLTVYNNDNSGVYLDFNWGQIASMIANPLMAPATVALGVSIKG